MPKRNAQGPAYSTPKPRCLPNDQYQIGWICALPIELAAALAVLDQEHGLVKERAASDTNSYHAGVLQGHNVVIACMPDGEYGTNAAATTAANMFRSFRNIRFGLLVGIAGGLPNPQRGPDFDVRLGDVVVSSGKGASGGVIQYDMGKRKQNYQEIPGHGDDCFFQPTGSLDRPPMTLRAALSGLRTQHHLDRSQVPEIMEKVASKIVDDEGEKLFKFPGTKRDQLFSAKYVHRPASGMTLDCTKCDQAQIVRRPSRSDPGPKVFYGTILSGNSVIKNAQSRDRLAETFASYEPLCVEMEAAGLMNNFPCMVIRGICDYADSHKNDDWHNYAALAAAAFAKDLLYYVSVDNTKQADETPLHSTSDETSPVTSVLKPVVPSSTKRAQGKDKRRNMMRYRVLTDVSIRSHVTNKPRLSDLASSSIPKKETMCTKVALGQLSALRRYLNRRGSAASTRRFRFGPLLT